MVPLGELRYLQQREVMMDFRTERLAALADRVRRRELSSVELVTHAIERLEAVNPGLGAFVAWDGDRALDEARMIDSRIGAGEEVGPLAGIPIGVKDLEDAAGFVTTHGSALEVDSPAATTDSLHVARLRAAGCVVLGKTNAPEYGHKAVTDNVPFGPTRNPWSAAHTAGGSSGGSAAALAAGIVPLATGSDGGGSIRIPAALCGLSGLKPQQGRIPIPGSAGPGTGLLTVEGPMAVTAADIAFALDAVVGPDARDPFSLPRPASSWSDRLVSDAPPARVGWSPDLGFAEVDAQVRRACEAAVEALAASGCEVVEIAAPFREEPALDFLRIWTVSRRKVLGHLEGGPRWDQVDPGLRELVAMGEQVTAVEHARTLDACYAANHDLASVFEQVQVLLLPTCAALTPEVGKLGTIDGAPHDYWTRFPAIFNMTRHPAGTVCAGFSDDGLPVGLQIVGPHFEEAAVLATIQHLERLLDLNLVPS
jgi:Asp-tRNA(Asn)/Glu-tRNA(Gln) amidotransferase A subunit family amidase